MTETIVSPDAWRPVRWELESGDLSLGFVPTMGALHRGHISLVERSLEENDRTVVSLFVNPTQFDDPNDLRRYPRTLEADRALLEELGVPFLFLPAREAIYPDGYRFRVVEEELSGRLCGAHRPGHFDGVLTVVLRLLQIIRPARAYFGEKDYQQFLLVRDMAAAFFLDMEIVSCPTVREADGLALSSRNALLSPAARERAARFPALLADGSPEEARRNLEAAGFEVDYVEEMDGRRLAAVVLDGVRLIDNLELPAGGSGR